MISIPDENRAWAFWQASKTATVEIEQALDRLAIIVANDIPLRLSEEDVRTVHRAISTLTQKFNLLTREQNQRVRR